MLWHNIPAFPLVVVEALLLRTVLKQGGSIWPFVLEDTRGRGKSYTTVSSTPAAPPVSVSDDYQAEPRPSSFLSRWPSVFALSCST